MIDIMFDEYDGFNFNDDHVELSEIDKKTAYERSSEKHIETISLIHEAEGWGLWYYLINEDIIKKV